MTRTAGNAGGAQFALAVSNAAVTLTVPSGATGAVIDNSGTQVIRYTTDGSTPSATAGNRLLNGGQLNWSGSDIDYGAMIRALKLISETGVQTTVEVQYYVYSG